MLTIVDCTNNHPEFLTLNLKSILTWMGSKAAIKAVKLIGTFQVFKLSIQLFTRPSYLQCYITQYVVV